MTGRLGNLPCGSDNFKDANDDQSNYGDGDVGSSSSAAAGPDQLTDQTNDTDPYNLGDQGQAVYTSTSPNGAVTTVTVNGSGSDNGTTRSHDDVTDNETLPAGTTGGISLAAGQTDNITFDECVKGVRNEWL